MPPGDLRLVRELVNTLDVEAGRDALAAPGGLAAFARQHGLALADDDLGAVCELREALRAACLAHAGRDLPADRRATLDRLLADAPLVVRVDGAGAAELRPADGLRGVPALTARIAVAVARGQAEGTWRRLKACEADTCLMAYYDVSPAGRRRWCSMQVCGARAKMRAYRSRRRPS